MLLTVLVAAFLGYMASNHVFGKKTADFESLLNYPSLKTFSGFELINHKQEKVTIDSFDGHWTLLFFGFTHCPDVCPTTLTELQKTFKILQSKNLKSMPQVLFVSVDPERDNPNTLKEYISFFNPTFNAATADASNILSIASQVGVAYHIAEHEKNSLNYTVDHTAAVFLVNPEKQLYGIFKSPHDSNMIANDLIKLIGINE